MTAMIDPISQSRIKKGRRIMLAGNHFDAVNLRRWLRKSGNIVNPCTRAKLTHEQLVRLDVHPCNAGKRSVSRWVARGGAARKLERLQTKAELVAAFEMEVDGLLEMLTDEDEDCHFGFYDWKTALLPVLEDLFHVDQHAAVTKLTDLCRVADPYIRRYLTRLYRVMLLRWS